MYSKIVQNTKFVYILYTKLVLHKSKYCMIISVQKVYIKFLHIYINVQTVANLYKVQAKNLLKLKIYIFCSYKQCTNYRQRL